MLHLSLSPFFFFNDTATTEIYTLSLHDALPISSWGGLTTKWYTQIFDNSSQFTSDRKSTRLNSSHANISYAVFCLKKKIRPPSPAGFHREMSMISAVTVSLVKEARDGPVGFADD